MRHTSSPTSSRGDVDLRTTTTSGSQRPSGNNPNQSHDLFDDTNFRLPSHCPDLRDVDLRLTPSPPGPGPSVHSTAYENTRLSTNPLGFLKLPSGPATEIDATINSHPPFQYKLKTVLGVEKLNYGYIRDTMTPSQLLKDPRLGPRPESAMSASLSLIPDPASLPSSSNVPSVSSPASIPAEDNLIMDPRVRRTNVHGQQPQIPLPPSQMPGLLSDLMLPRDP